MLTDGEDGIDARDPAYMGTSGGHAPRNDGTGGAGRGYNYAGAGGGGSYNSDSNKYDSSTLGYNTSDGKVVITIN